MEDIILIVQAKDKMIEKLQNTVHEQDIKLARKEDLIIAQKQALDFLWSRLEDKQFLLDRQTEQKRLEL